MTTDILILTGWGGKYGSGHFRRMLLLASHLQNKFNCKVEVCGENLPVEKYSNSGISIAEKYSSKCALIIHDRRDSTHDEMDLLKKIAPVITIDDVGEGRLSASAAIDLLPNLEFPPRSISNMFLYGYDFFENVKIAKDNYKRQYDFLYYFASGNEADLRVVKKLTDLKKILILENSSVYFDERGGKILSAMSYVEALLQSEYVITHFGILPYEALLCGCCPVFINPSLYHNDLASKESLFRNMLNLGTYDNLKLDAVDDINKLKFSGKNKKADDIIKHITENLDRFAQMIFTYI